MHDLYIELTKLDYDLKALYDYSIKELLFILKYKREGLAYKIWRQGSINRLAQHAKEYPIKLEEAMDDLFEKKKAKMPDWLKEDYKQKLEKQANRMRGE